MAVSLFSSLSLLNPWKVVTMLTMGCLSEGEVFIEIIWNSAWEICFPDVYDLFSLTVWTNRNLFFRL